MSKPKSKWPAYNTETWPTAKIKPNPKNSKRHSEEQVAQIAASMDEWGWTVPCLIDEKGVLIAGEGRWLAAKLRGFAEVPCIVARGWSAAQKRAYLIADNRLTELGEWDRDLLRIELTDLAIGGFDIALTGFDLSDLAPVAGNVDADAVPEKPKTPSSRAGDIWICGDHRVLCGDSTKGDDVRTLMAERKPNLMVTDPPYGVDYDPSWRVRAGVNLNKAKLGKVANDGRADWTDAWKLFPGNVVYIWHGGLHAGVVQQSISASGFKVRSQIVWAKDRLVLSRGDYHWRHEPCWYAVREGKPGKWAGDRSQTTVWDIPAREDSGHGHGTQKPVECMARPMRNNSKPGDAVYDPFLGSGTTMIAAEMERRRCLGIDIDPIYVGVAVMRWQTFTGKSATLDGDGRTFDEIAAERRKKKPRLKASARSSKVASRADPVSQKVV